MSPPQPANSATYVAITAQRVCLNHTDANMLTPPNPNNPRTVTATRAIRNSGVTPAYWPTSAKSGSGVSARIPTWAQRAASLPSTMSVGVTYAVSNP